MWIPNQIQQMNAPDPEIHPSPSPKKVIKIVLVWKAQMTTSISQATQNQITVWTLAAPKLQV